MPIELNQILTEENPVRALFKLEGSSFEKLLALSMLFVRTKPAKLKRLFDPDTSFLDQNYNLMNHLIDSLQEEANPEDQKILLLNTLAFIKNNKSIFTNPNLIDSQKFFTAFFEFHKLLHAHKESLSSDLYKSILGTLFDITTDYINKINLACLSDNKKTLTPDHLLTSLSLIKDYYLVYSDDIRLCNLVDSIYEYIAPLSNDSTYVSVAFELIKTYPLSDLQLAKLTSFKNMIKAKLNRILDGDTPSIQRELIKQTFCLTEHNQTSQLYLFFILQQELTCIMLAENNYAQFRITDDLLSDNTNTLNIAKEIAAKHPDLILEIILKSETDYQLFLLRNSKIKIAVVNYLIEMASSIGFDEKTKGRAYLADLLAINDHQEPASKENNKLYSYFAIPQNAHEPINGVLLKKEKKTASLKFILSEAKKYRAGRHLSDLFTQSDSAIEMQTFAPTA